MKRSSCIICSCVNSFTAHASIYIKQRTWGSCRLCDPAASSSRSSSRPALNEAAVRTRRPALSSQLCSAVKPDPAPCVNHYKASTNGSRSRTDLHLSALSLSLSYSLSLWRSGAGLGGKCSSVAMPTALCFADLVWANWPTERRAPLRENAPAPLSVIL